ncbi:MULTISPECIES: hypothetical protein [Burkholderia cepacia complex]|uniref:hypothetical protein n=1 Tax=Burkholderia cepacia complex TaxID=87882 RepID=UPI0009823A5D|nr:MULTISPECIES: hypothetical protein [Burkholderia cepacia complex]MCA8156427.1 type-F conjugative transfer system secretin TraK [Burkholderia contaminans]
MKFAFNRQSPKLCTAFRPRLVFAAMMFLTTTSAHAIQVVKGADRQTQQVSISAAEYNVLSMSGGAQLFEDRASSTRLDLVDARRRKALAHARESDRAE